MKILGVFVENNEAEALSLKLKNTRILAKNIRINAVNMVNSGGSSHIGSILSIADILAVLYECVLHYDSKYPNLKNRDRFLLSKGHAGAGVYAVLAEKNFFPKANLKMHYKNGSKLSGHVSHKDIPGVEISTGSLGHGLPIATGMALSAKINNESHRIVVLMSDGECNEGSNWESALFASHHNLKNLTIIIDRNNLQSIKTTEETLKLEPFKQKWESFGWNVSEVDGHNHSELLNIINYDNNNDKPNCIIAKTTKGKGVSFMENSVLWHYRTPQNNEFKEAILELEKISEK